MSYKAYEGYLNHIDDLTDVIDEALEQIPKTSMDAKDQISMAARCIREIVQAIKVPGSTEDRQWEHLIREERFNG